MRVVVAHNRYQEAGGEDVVFEEEVRLLRSHGHQVFTWERSNAELDTWSPWQKAQLLWRTSWSRASYTKFRAFVRDTRPEIIHVHNTLPLLSPAIYYAADREHVPVVQTLHNYRMVCPSGLLLREGRPCQDCVGRLPTPAVAHGCYRGSRIQTAAVAGMSTLHRLGGTWARQIAAYITLTQFGRQLAIRGGLPAERLHVKPNFVVDPGPSAVDEMGTYALFVGRLADYKGVATLLDAWLGPNAPDLPLYIAGDGPLRTQLEARLQQRPDARVRLLGQLDQRRARELMRQARLVVIPSECYEGFPRVLVEAFALGTPVVGSRLGALAELIQDGDSGVLFTAGDAGDLARKVSHVQANTDLLRRLATIGRATYLARYTPEINYQLLLNVYRSAVDTYTGTSLRRGNVTPRIAASFLEA